MKTLSDSLIRDARPGDFDQIVALNAGEVRWTSPMSNSHLENLVSLSAYQKVLLVDSGVAGFMIAMAGDSGYENENLDWFRVRYENFLYIDRIVIDREHAGAGLGRTFYDDVFSYAEENSYERVVCEYSIVPLNEASKAFHARMGFVELGKRQLPASGKEVSMQSKVVKSP